jgi:hypothetical protein
MTMATRFFARALTTLGSLRLMEGSFGEVGGGRLDEPKFLPSTEETKMHIE